MIKYTLNKGTKPEITVKGAVKFKGSHQFLMKLHTDTKARIEALQTKGSFTATSAALIEFALNHIEQNNLNLSAIID